VSTPQKPAILTVASERALFEFKRHSARKRVLALLLQSLHIIRMKDSRAKVRRLHFVRGQTRVFEDGLIGIENAPICR